MMAVAVTVTASTAMVVVADIGGECWVLAALEFSLLPSPWEKSKEQKQTGTVYRPHGVAPSVPSFLPDRERERERECTLYLSFLFFPAPGASESVPMDAAASRCSYSPGTGGKCEKFLLRDSNRVPRLPGHIKHNIISGKRRRENSI